MTDGREFELDNVARSEAPSPATAPVTPAPGQEMYGDPAEERYALHARNRTRMIASFVVAFLAIVLTMVLALVIKDVLLILLALMLWGITVIAVIVGLRLASKRS